MKSVLRIDPLEKRDAQAGDVLSFVIPTGTYDFSTLNLWFLATMTGNSSYQSLPRDVETMIEAFEIWVDDVKVQNINNYNQLVRIMLDYNCTHDDKHSRIYFSNSAYINSNLNNSVFTVNNSTYVCTKWFGLLGSLASLGVVNTDKLGSIKIVITFAPNAVLAANVTTAVYTLDDIHMSLYSMETYLEPRNVITFDNFSTLIQYNSTYQQSTQLNVYTKKLDYVLSTFLPPDYRSKAISATTDSHGSSYYFAHGSALTATPNYKWNFKINGKNVIGYNPSHLQFMQYMNNLFPNTDVFPGTYQNRVGSSAAIVIANVVRYLWACGVAVDYENQENAIDVCFDTYVQPTSGTFATINYSLLIAKYTSKFIYNPTTDKYEFQP